MMTQADLLKDSARTPRVCVPWKMALLFFFGVSLVYVSLSPFNFRISGYMEEEISATRQLLEWMHLISDRISASSLVRWPRNGLLALAVHVPFVASSHWVFGDSLFAENVVLAFQPILLTSGIATIVFVWASSLSESRRLGLALGLGAAFATMLWPYAYIGMETQQSLFLLLAAYIAIERRESLGVSWPILFALSCAMAVGVKSTGALLLPAVIFLIVVHARRSTRPALRSALAGSAVLGALLFAGYTRSFFWAELGGTQQYIRFWLVRDPFSWLLNNVSFLASPNKGLLVFSPLLLLGFLGLPSMLRRRDPLAVFTLLTLGGLIAGFALLTCWADENWGPRYLHSAVAPLALCAAGVRWRLAPKIATTLLALVLVLLSFGISALGALFWYGSLHQVSVITEQNRLEWIQGDVTWNHILFNGRLFRIWMAGREDREGGWAPKQVWYFEAPPGAPKAIRVDLGTLNDLNARPVALPQSYALRRLAESGGQLRWMVLFAAPLLLGIALLGLCARSLREPGRG